MVDWHGGETVFDHAFDDTEMFQLDQVDIPIEGTIRQLAVGNEVLAMIVDEPRQKNWEVAVYDLVNFKTILSRGKDDDVHKIFTDPTGTQVLISLENGENYHCYVGKMLDPKAAKCANLQGIVIESVGWDKLDVAGLCLLGDMNGFLHEAKFDKNGCKHRRQVCNLETKAPVTCVEIERFDTGNSLWVGSTSSSRLFQFVGGPTLEGVFANQRPPFLREMPGTHSDLTLYRKRLDQPPVCFAWCTQAGIMHGTMDFTKPQDSVLYSETPLLFDTTSSGHDPSLKGVALFEHYFILLYADRIQAVAQPPGLSWVAADGSHRLKPSDIKSRTVWQKTFPAGIHNEGRSIVRNLSTGRLHIVSKKCIYELLVFDNTHSNHTTWRMFMERGIDPNEKDRESYFPVALSLCKGDAKKTARVNQAKGDYYFDIGEYGLAARVYAATTTSLEATVIKYIKHGIPDALLSFVLQRLHFMQKRIASFRQEATQMCCLCTWVVQLHLAQLNQLTDNPVRYEEVQTDFHYFIETYIEYTDKATVFELIASLAKPEELLYFVELLKDYKRVIAQYVTHNKLDKALECLIQNCTSEEYEELWYQFSPRLVQHAPHVLVSGWMATGKSKTSFLKPPRLIPALMKYHIKYNPPDVRQNQAIRYLKWLVDERDNRDPAIHNMLLSSYAKQPSDKDLLDFLIQHRDDHCYDLKYALRLCLTEKKHRGCVHIYTALTLYEDAVRFALKTDDLELAKHVVESVDSKDVALRKKLWIVIVQHVVANTPGGVKKAIALTAESRVLELEDILPHFPEFTQVQDFKSDVCGSLIKYQQKTDKLMRDMERVSKTAADVNADIEQLKYGWSYVTESQRCNACMYPCLAADFVLFPACRHAYHEKCLLSRFKKALPDNDPKR
eukprot:gene11621-17918_t